MIEPLKQNRRANIKPKAEKAASDQKKASSVASEYSMADKKLQVFQFKKEIKQTIESVFSLLHYNK